MQNKKKRMKHLACNLPKDLCSISGAKRRTNEAKDENDVKKQCIQEDSMSKKVEGASPQMAPKCP